MPPETSAVSETTNKTDLRLLEYSSSDRLRNRTNAAGLSSFVSEASMAFVLTGAIRGKHNSNHRGIIRRLMLPIFIAKSSIAEFFKNFAADCGNAFFPAVASAKPWTLDNVLHRSLKPDVRLQDGIRLSCQAQAIDNLVIDVSDEVLSAETTEIEIVSTKFVTPFIRKSTFYKKYITAII